VTNSSPAVQGEAVDVDAIIQDAAEAPKELPGLNAGGLMNFFRILTPPSSSTELGQGQPQRGKDVSHDPMPQASAADGCPPVRSTEAAPDDSSDDGGRCCMAAHGTCGYTQRCNRGFTESGAPLRRFATGQFDTVVDTFGLCSHEDPVQVRA
jgi:methyltransferase OMS1